MEENINEELTFISLSSNAKTQGEITQILWVIIRYQGISAKFAGCFVSARRGLLINGHSLKYFGGGSTYVGT